MSGGFSLSPIATFLSSVDLNYCCSCANIHMANFNERIVTGDPVFPNASFCIPLTVAGMVIVAPSFVNLFSVGTTPWTVGAHSTLL